MIELRTFDGTADELAEFCTRVWRTKYINTDMPVPMWSGEFLDWELFGEGPLTREFLVAAYDGIKLVGVLPCRPMWYQLRGQRVFGTLGSYFSVDPDYETKGVAMKLNLEQIRRHRQYDAKFLVGFVYLGASAAKGKDFWLRQPRSVKRVATLGQSIRVLDPVRVASFERSFLHRLGLRALRMIQPAPRVGEGNSVREYQESHLPDCLRLIQQRTEQTDFSMTWDEPALQRQLSYKEIPHTFVALENDRVEGFINYQILDIVRSDKHGTNSITAGVVELLQIEQLSSNKAKQLINAALVDMRQRGCHLAMMLRVPGSPNSALRRSGFIKQPADCHLTAQQMSPEFEFPSGVHSLQALFR